MADAEGRYRFVNPAFCRLTGYSAEELLQMKIVDLVPVGKGASLFEQVFQEGSGKREVELLKKDGTTFAAEFYGDPVEIEGELCALGLLRDITERKRAEEDLQQSAETLAAKSRELETRNAELQELLDEIKALRGILPLCSFCKKIRDDEGYWEQVDDYIRDHSEAKISHSICPDCMKEHYPDYRMNEDGSPAS